MNNTTKPTECINPDCDSTEIYARGVCLVDYGRVRSGTLVIDLLPTRRRRVEVPGYHTMHARLKRIKGSAKNFPCIDECGRQAQEWSYQGGAPDEREEDVQGRGLLKLSSLPEFYAPRCKSCHKLKDNTPEILEARRAKLVEADLDELMDAYPNEVFLTPALAAEHAGVTENTIQTWMGKRDLPYEKFGYARRYVATSALDAWLESQAAPNPLIAAIKNSTFSLEEIVDYAVERVVRDEDMREALRGLTFVFRAVVVLIDFAHLEYHEVAEVMGSPIGTVMSRLHRGRGRVGQPVKYPNYSIAKRKEPVDVSI